MNLPFSVLMPVYHKENPAYLDLALASIINQTLPPREIVIVEDGPLTKELDNVIANFKNKYTGEFTTIAMEKNQGLGIALQMGLKNCRHDLIARMDADDISHPNRFEKQVFMFKNDPELAVTGSTIAEFEYSIKDIIGYRSLPCTPEELLVFSKRRNPLNHMSVMFKKSIIEKVGGYLPCLGFEDYYLWIRILQQGYKISNIPEPLVYARVKGMHKKRVGFAYLKNEIKLQYQFYQLGYIGLLRMLVNILIRNLPRLLPPSFLKIFYNKLLRKNSL